MNHTNNFTNNTSQQPIFKNPDVLHLADQKPENYRLSSLPEFMCDFSLQSGSPGKKSALPLTKVTVSSTNSNIIKVQDSLYFYDGYNIEKGDKIIIGSNSPVTVVKVIDTNTISVDRSINVSANDKIYLSKTTTSGDLGVYGCLQPTTNIPAMLME